MSDGRYQQNNPGGHPPQVPQRQTEGRQQWQTEDHQYAGRPRRADGSGSHPGWLARSLFWAAIVLGYLPALIVVPLMSSGDPVLIGIYAGANLIAGILRLLLGSAALLLVKQTSWTRRLIAGGIFLLACLYSLVIVPFTPLIIESLAGAGSSSVTSGIVLSLQSAILLALMFVSWNVARNRRWWVLIVAVVWAGVCAGVAALIQTTIGSSGPVNAGPTIVVQLSTAVLSFLGLGLFHLLGRIRGASVPPPAPKPQSVGQWGPMPSVGGQSNLGAGQSFGQQR